MKAAYVSFFGPEPVQDRHGDEYPEWSVSIMTDDEFPIKQYTARSFNAGYKLASDIARDRHLEFVNDAQRA